MPAPPKERPKRKKLGELLIEDKLIDEFQLTSALAHQKKWGGRLGSNLIALGAITGRQLLDYLSRKMGLEVVDLATIKIEPKAMEKVSKELAAKHGVMPIRIAHEGPVTFLIMAMSDPTNLLAIDEIQFSSSLNVRPVIADEAQIVKAIQTNYSGARIDARSAISQTPISSEPGGAAPKEGKDFVIYGMKTTADGQTKGMAGDPLTLVRTLINLLIDKKIFTEDEFKQKMASPTKKFGTP